jgi:hypothetical protein
MTRKEMIPIVFPYFGHPVSIFRIQQHHPQPQESSYDFNIRSIIQNRYDGLQSVSVAGDFDEINNCRVNMFFEVKNDCAKYFTDSIGTSDRVPAPKLILQPRNVWFQTLIVANRMI